MVIYIIYLTANFGYGLESKFKTLKINIQLLKILKNYLYRFIYNII